MDTNTAACLKERLERLISYQEIFTKNTHLAQCTCDEEFSTLLSYHNDLRHKYADLRAYTDQLDRHIEQYRIELARKDKKIQSQSSQILRLTQHNKRNNERLTELQQCLEQIKGSITERNTYNQLHDLLRNSIMSESEMTADLSDRYCTGDELEVDYSHMPKVVSQSAGIGDTKQPINGTNNMEIDKSSPITNEQNSDQLSSLPTPVPSRHSLSAKKRPKQKIRRPSKEFLNTKSEESELNTDDVFWSQPDHQHDHEPKLPVIPSIEKSTSPVLDQKTLTPSTPTTHFVIKSSPSSISKFHARSHNFISRNILIPETCCVCLKRINFGKLAYRCQVCHALCHTGCKENCTTLCLPNVKTPNRGAVSKFTSRETSQLQIPALLVHCINEIERRGLQEVGIYRLNALESQVKELKERILKSRTGLFDLSHYNDVHLICGVVKDFLRSLSESLLTDNLWKSFASIIDEESDVVKQEKFDLLIEQLPKPNRDTLAFLILHLQRIAESPSCRMPIINLSRTMGPAVIGYSSKHVSGIDIVGETYKQTKILEHCLKLSSDYWMEHLEMNIRPIATPNAKQHIGTPVLVREYRDQTTPKVNYPAPSHTFFSPI